MVASAATASRISSERKSKTAPPVLPGSAGGRGDEKGWFRGVAATEASAALPIALERRHLQCKDTARGFAHQEYRAKAGRALPRRRRRWYCRVVWWCVMRSAWRRVETLDRRADVRGPQLVDAPS